MKRKDVDKPECSLWFCFATFTLGYNIIAGLIKASIGFCAKILKSLKKTLTLSTVKTLSFGTVALLIKDDCFQNYTLTLSL
jgi:hypothetical protein